ncbi:MAG: DUF5060 domain-containing protein [Planctomycetota bacterium]
MKVGQIRLALGGLIAGLLVAALVVEIAARNDDLGLAAASSGDTEGPPPDEAAIPGAPPYYRGDHEGPLAVEGIEELRSGPYEPAGYQPTDGRTKDTWRQWEKYEVRFGLTWSFRNPYDPESVAVDVLVKTPTGERETVPAFWYVPCTGRVVDREDVLVRDEDTPQVERIEARREAACWMLRYTPREEGEYRYRIVVRTPTASAASREVRFSVAGRAGRGFVRPSRENPRYFEFDDGSAFVPVGLNVAWPNDLGSVDYARYMATLRHYGANWSRLWLTHFFRGTSIEWSRSRKRPYYHGLGFYSAEVAWRLDRMLESAERNGVYVAWCIQHHGQFSTRYNPDWATNPYNAACGGFLEDPEDFFTDARARELFRKRVRYYVARYGYSPNVFAWELWNEVDLTDRFSDGAVTAWHDEMGRYLKQIDASDRMVTTSYVRSYTGEAFELPGHDYRQVHIYHGDPSTIFGWQMKSVESQMGSVEPGRLGKPVLIGEYGLGHAETYFELTPDSVWPVDPDGLHVHNSLWMGVFSGSAGTAMNWWWDTYIRENDLYFHLTGISRFLEGEDPRPLKNDVVKLFALFARTPPVEGYVLSGRERALGWLFETAYTLASFAPTGEPRGGVTVELDGLTDGPYRVEFWDTYDGLVTARRRVTVVGGRADFPVPSFRGDIAFKLIRLSPDTPPPTSVQSYTPIHDRMIDGLLALADRFPRQEVEEPTYEPPDRWEGYEEGEYEEQPYGEEGDGDEETEPAE